MSIVKCLCAIVALFAGLFVLDCTAGTTKDIYETPPLPCITVNMSFPNGAPGLNQTGKLACVIKAFTCSGNMSYKVLLPEGIAYVSDDLSWAGNIEQGGTKEIITIIKPVHNGNYTIEAKINIPPGPQLGGLATHQIYVAVNGIWAEWGIYPPWGKKGGFPVPIEPIQPPAQR